MSSKRYAEEATLLGRRYGKLDLERVGFFDDVQNGPHDLYTRTGQVREDVGKGRQMHPGPIGELFDKEFKRIFVGEALPTSSEPISRTKKRKELKTGLPLRPPAPSKKHSTPGDSYGCFSKPTYFSPAVRAERKRKKGEMEPPNFKIKPGKLGGPGYVDICFNSYPDYAHEPYDPEVDDKKKRREVKKQRSKPSFVSASTSRSYFPPNPYFDETPGPTYVRPKVAMPKAAGPIYVPFPKSLKVYNGTFSQFPLYASEPYNPEVKRTVFHGPPWIGGGPDLRTKYTNSIIGQVTAVSCNSNNYREYRERVYPLAG